MGEIRVPLTPISDDDLPDNVAGGDNLKAGSITANKILAHSITANEIAAGTITANEIKAGTITANEIAAGAITADKISLTLNDIPDGNDSDPNKNYAKVLSTSIQAGKIILSETSGTLDDISDGISHKSVTANEKSGAARAYNGLDPGGAAIKYVAPMVDANPTISGLYLDATHLGYYYADQQGNSRWKTYMDNYGHFYLSGDGDNSLTWDGTTLTIIGNITASTITGSTLNTATTGERIEITKNHEINLYDAVGNEILTINSGNSAAYLSFAMYNPSIGGVHGVGNIHTVSVSGQPYDDMAIIATNHNLNLSGSNMVDIYVGPASLQVKSDGVYVSDGSVGKIWFDDIRYLYNNGDDLYWHKSSGDVLIS